MHKFYIRLFLPLQSFFRHPLDRRRWKGWKGWKTTVVLFCFFCGLLQVVRVKGHESSLPHYAGNMHTTIPAKLAAEENDSAWSLSPEAIAAVPPVISNLDGDVDYYTERGDRVNLDNKGDATVTDADSPNFNGGELRILITDNAQPHQDQLVLNVSGEITMNESTLLYNGNLIGTFELAASGDSLIVHFTTDYATPAAVTALLRGTLYGNWERVDPFTGDRTVTVKLDDGTGQTTTATLTVKIIPINDPPTLSATAHTFTYSGGSEPTASLFSAVSINLAEHLQKIKKLDLTVANVQDGGDEQLYIDGRQVGLAPGNTGKTTNGINYRTSLVSGQVLVELSADTGILSDRMSETLNHLTYRNNSPNPTAATRSIALTYLQDDGGTLNGGVDFANLSGITASVKMVSPDAFITTWQTTTDNESITIPINTDVAGYDYTVDWGDGNTLASQHGNATHVYDQAGTYTVAITGAFPAIRFADPGSDSANDAKLLTIEQWGTQVWLTMNNAFEGCVNLTTESTGDVPQFTDHISLYSMFAGCTAFNSDLNDWDISKVFRTDRMFLDASSFNGNITDWDVSAVEDMGYMFRGASAFNQDIGGWNVSQVTNMNFMFSGAAAFDQDLDKWDVSNVENMSQMFQEARSFNGNISTWDVSNVKGMFAMFEAASVFNQELGDWDVSRVKNMGLMFRDAYAFNAPIGQWQVDSVTNMRAMFFGADSFNQDISLWKVSQVTNMSYLFAAANSFNQDISAWDVSRVTNMSYLFTAATSFDQNLGAWEVSQVTDMTSMLSQSALSTANYDSTLMGWATQAVQPDVALGALDLTYCAGAQARTSLIADHGWTISGDQEDPDCGMHIWVTTPDKDTLHLQTFTSSSIEQLMHSIEDSTGIPVAEQQLHFRGQVLERGRTIADYNIQREDTLMLTVILAVTPDANGIVYVDSAIATPGDGSSWDKALRYLSDATKAANDQAEAVAEIHVATGTYFPTGMQGGTNRDSAFLFLNGGLKLLGGYPHGGGERDVQAYPTILSGNVNDVADTTDNSYHVMVIAGLTGEADSLIIDGFTVTGGFADGGSVPRRYWKGQLVRGSFAGGIYLTHAGNGQKTVIRSCRIEHNYAAERGGGAYCLAASPRIEGSLIRANRAVAGAGLSCENAGPYILKSQIIDNIAAGIGGGLQALVCNIVARNVRFEGNHANTGGAIDNDYRSDNTFENCLIVNNRTAEEGSAVFNFNARVHFINCTISGNLSKSGGGVMHQFEGATFVTNTIVYGNNRAFSNEESVPVVAYSLVEDSAYDGRNHNLDGTKSYDLFVDTAAGNFQLKADSIVINKGSNDSIPADLITDLAGHARIYDRAGGGVVDLGAYEYQGIVTFVHIVAQPQDTMVCPSADASFIVAADGMNPTYQWQSSEDAGAHWSDVTGGDGPRLALSQVAPADSGRWYRAIVKGTAGADTSTAAVLGVYRSGQITAQPRDTTVAWQGNARFMVKTSGAVTGFQWQSAPDGADWSNIAGATSNALDVTDAQLADSGRQYRVVVTTPCGAFTSAPATLHVESPVLVLRPETLNNAFAGVPYSVSFEASGGTEPYSYQLTDSDLPNTLILANGVLSGRPDAAGTYSFSVTATDGSSGAGAPFSVTRAYTLEVLAGGSCMQITSWPADQTLCAGEDATFSVTGRGITSYQWQSKAVKSDTWADISGATAATLRVEKATLAQSGWQYRVLLGSTDCGTLTSQPVTLTVNGAVEISSQPEAATVCAGGDATFSLTATGTDLTYQWESSTDGVSWVELEGETAAALQVANVAPGQNGSQYRAIVRSLCGKVTSASASLTVNGGVTISVQPKDVTVCAGATATFSTTAAGAGLSYQWQSSIDGQRWSDVDGAETATFELPEVQNAQSGQQYRVIVTGTCGQVLSDAATLTVDPLVSITRQPEDQTVDEGGDAVFSVTAAGATAYQWKTSHDGGQSWQVLPDATAANLQLAQVTMDNNGSFYTVLVTGKCGVIASDTVALYVTAHPVITLLPNALPAATVGQSYHQDLHAEGGTTPYQYRVTAGALPANLTLESSTGALSGTPSAAGTFPVTIQATGANHFSGSRRYTLQVQAPVLTLEPESLATGFVGVSYHQQLTASGGTGPYMYTLTSGRLPEGLRLEEDGMLSGNPSESGTFENIVITATDASSGTNAPFSVAKSFSLKILGTGSCMTVQQWPAAQTVCTGSTAHFTVDGTGIDGLQWQSKAKDASSWQDIPGATSETLSLEQTTVLQNGTQYRVILSSTDCGSLTSQPVTLTVNGETVITGQPVDTTACAGETARFSVTATGSSLTYQWQSSADGRTWNNIAGATSEVFHTPTLEVKASGTQYRVVVQGSCGEVTSEPASVTVQPATSIDAQPEDQTVCAGDDATFTVTASGAARQYQWQTSTDGSTWKKIDGATSNRLTVSDPTEEQSGTQYRVWVDGACESVASAAATLSVQRKVTILTQPADLTVCAGDDAFFAVRATGTGLSYQWQSSVEGDSWHAIQGATSATLTVTRPTAESTGTQYRVLIAGACGQRISQAAVLVVNATTTLAAQPEDATVCAGDDAVFHVTAKGTGLTYQWQASTDGKIWLPIDGATDDQLQLAKVTTAENGNQYRVAVQGSCQQVISQVAMLTVHPSTAIVTQPADVTVCENDRSGLTVTASGLDLSYQWQSSVDGNDWTEIKGATKATLSLSGLEATDNGMQYRVLVSGACDQVISEVATVTVRPLPSLSIVADSANPVSKGWPVHLTASGAQRYQWANSPGIQSGWNAALLTIRPQEDATYTVTGTSADGCQAQQSYAVQVVTDYKLICNNIVSPYKDGKNDSWIIQNISSYPNNEVMIYDRAGRMIYQKKGYNNQWNGMLNGGLLKEGTYYYVFIVDGGKKVFKGYIELLSGKR